jgi:glycosyltransferase involved in cell wall biosynthesis
MSDRMKIAWFTPFHVNSAIAEFSQHITRELAKDSEVEIWTSDDAPLLDTDLQLVGYRPGSAELEDLRGRDVIVYNMGNYLGYHGSIYSVARQYPGVVILHDRALHHLFADMWLLGDKPNRQLYVERMTAHYGEDGENIALASLRGERRPVWESDDDIRRYPLYEESIVTALGVVVHSESQAREVQERWLGPVTTLHLPCYREVLQKAGKTPRPEKGDRLRLLTMGHVNPNKQVHQVIKLLTDHPELAARTEYLVVGSDGGFTAYRDTLRELVAESRSDVRVDIVGRLADEDLEREMERADIFINFRHPNIEGGSASLMKQLAYGRPVLCFDSGFFGELPDGAVARVPVGDFGAAAVALREVVCSASRRRELGERARTVAEEYSEHCYAESLLALLDIARRASPVLGCLDSVGRELGHMGADGRLPIFDEIASDFARIFDV